VDIDFGLLLLVMSLFGFGQACVVVVVVDDDSVVVLLLAAAATPS
jgi:hypothetical protein